jgi:hypothetical protein
MAGRLESFLDQEDAEGGPAPLPGADTDPRAPQGEVQEVQEDLGTQGLDEDLPDDEDDLDDDEGVEIKTEAGDESVIDTFAELAQSFEVEEDELLAHLQIQGNDGDTVPLAEVVDFYRKGPSLNETMIAEVEKTRTELTQINSAQVRALEEATARIIQRVQSQTEPDGGWDELRNRDPAEYIRLKEEHSAERMVAKEAMDALENNRREQADGQSQRRQEYVESQALKVYQLRPEWKDKATGEKAFEEIQSYLVSTGFPPEQMEALEDALSIVTVWKAAQYDKAQAQRPELKKRLRRLPVKQLRTSARRETVPAEEQQRARRAQFEKARKSGSVEDAAVLMSEHLK